MGSSDTKSLSTMIKLTLHPKYYAALLFKGILLLAALLVAIWVIREFSQYANVETEKKKFQVKEKRDLRFLSKFSHMCCVV